jgi:hypothetical protein
VGVLNCFIGPVCNQLHFWSLLLLAKQSVRLVPGALPVHKLRFSRKAPETFTLFKNFVIFRNMARLTSNIYYVDKNFCLPQNGGLFRNV